MMSSSWTMIPVVLAVSALIAGLVARTATVWGLVDIPNARSSHVRETPRGGGIGFVVAWATAMLLLTSRQGFDTAWWVFILAAIGVAAIGLADDVRGRSPKLRLLVHGVCVSAAVLAAGPLPQPFGASVALPYALVLVLWIMAIVWSVNLFNFMDGIDALAATEALFCAVVFGVLGQIAGAEVIASAGALLAAAVGGFLLLNWPPARIFMGDVGSGFLGAALGLIALALVARANVPLATVAIVPSLFVSDATVTLIRRILHGQRAFEAHRSHAYQVLARRWQSHRSVVLAACAMNLLFVAPMVALSVRHASQAWWFAGACYAVLVAIVVGVGAGKTDR